MPIYDRIMDVTTPGEVLSTREIAERITESGYPVETRKMASRLNVAVKFGTMERVEDARTRGRNAPSLWRRLP